MPSPALTPLLLPLAHVYAQAVALRAWLYRSGALKRRRLATEVVSVGNLSVGGTGKTPLVAWLARDLKERGLRVAILSRGYGRATRGRVLVADFDRVYAGPEEGGDEPAWLAIRCPGVAVVVGEDRAAAGRWAEERLRPDLFLLDDGFQHLSLERGLDIVTLDATEDWARMRLLPAGRLREPLTALSRAQAVVVTRAHREVDPQPLDRLVGSLSPVVTLVRARPRFTGLTDLDGKSHALDALGGRRVVALSAIGRPQQFERDVEDLGSVVAASLRYRDHRRFVPADRERIEAAALAARADLVVTTAKDLVRLRLLGGFRVALLALEMDLMLDPEGALEALVAARSQKR